MKQKGWKWKSKADALFVVVAGVKIARFFFFRLCRLLTFLSSFLSSFILLFFFITPSSFFFFFFLVHCPRALPVVLLTCAQAVKG